jgi:hypothetical protein
MPFLVITFITIPDDKALAREFLNRMYPTLKAFHRFLITDIDPEKCGLVTILHPWESGLDDPPRWDEALSRINVKEEDLPKFKRLDVISVGGESETIPSDWEYDRFIYLIDLIKKDNYDQKKMYKIFPFRIKDVVFSGILYVANKYMITIADIIGAERHDKAEIREWMSRAEQNFYRYFFLQIRVR